MKIAKLKAGEYVAEIPAYPAEDQLFYIRRDRYMGGWNVWSGCGIRWNDERYQTKAEAVAALISHYDY